MQKLTLMKAVDLPIQIDIQKDKTILSVKHKCQNNTFFNLSVRIENNRLIIQTPLNYLDKESLQVVLELLDEAKKYLK